jgi:D-glycero-alpha-D-manno-heptose 1-phosphate guanylyltransferase
MSINKCIPPSKALILAGGKGTRLKSVVSDVPKPMAPINDLPFLHYLIVFWKKQGIDEFIISVGYMADCIVDYFGTSYFGCEIKYIFESEPLGTGGAVLRSVREAKLDSPFIILNGDTFFPISLNVLNDHALSVDAGICISMFRTSELGRYSLIKFEKDSSIDFIQEDDLAELDSSFQKYANGGVYWVNPKFLPTYDDDQNISFENEILPNLMRTKSCFVSGYYFSGNFVDIGIPQDYLKAKLMESFKSKGAI